MSPLRILMAIAALLTVVAGGGCATTINHSYDPLANFGQLKSYAWAPGSAAYSHNSLVEANVQFLVDPLLEKKGFTKVGATPDFVIRLKFENYPVGISDRYELSVLDLNVYRPDGRTLIWRGTASGSISTDSKSADLRDAVQGILSAFPPR
jgi:hypothetical protein